MRYIRRLRFQLVLLSATLAAASGLPLLDALLYHHQALQQVAPSVRGAETTPPHAERCLLRWALPISPLVAVTPHSPFGSPLARSRVPAVADSAPRSNQSPLLHPSRAPPSLFA